MPLDKAATAMNTTSQEISNALDSSMTSQKSSKRFRANPDPNLDVSSKDPLEGSIYHSEVYYEEIGASLFIEKERPK